MNPFESITKVKWGRSNDLVVAQRNRLNVNNLWTAIYNKVKSAREGVVLWAAALKARLVTQQAEFLNHAHVPTGSWGMFPLA